MFRSVTRTHTNMCLRAATLACKTHIQELQSDDGKISWDKVLQLNKAFADPCEVGLNWLVIRHQVD